MRGNGDVDVTQLRLHRHREHRRALSCDADVTGKFEGNTYTGKGDAVPALDYAAEAGGGASVECTNNIVSNNSGLRGLTARPRQASW